MPTVAEQLRTAREARKLTIHQVAEATKIRTDHIRALEEGNFDVFVAPVYIRGFVRSCATLLKLEVPQVMSALEGELAQTEKFREPPPLSNEPRGLLDFLTLMLARVNWRKAGLLAAGLGLVGLCIGIFVVWRYFQTRDPLSKLPRAVYQSPGDNAGEKLPLTNAPSRR